MGERDDDMPAGANAPVNLTEDPVEIFDEAQCPHRYGEIDLVGPNEGELGRTGLVKFDRNAVFGCEGAGCSDLFGVAVGRDHARAPAVDLSALLQLTAWVREARRHQSHENAGEDEVIIKIRSRAVHVLDSWARRWYVKSVMSDDDGEWVPGTGRGGAAGAVEKEATQT